MRQIWREAMRAGAFGFSTSRTISHKTLKGDPTPTLRAQEDELMGIALGLKEAGAGVLEIVSDFNSPMPATEFGHDAPRGGAAAAGRSSFSLARAARPRRGLAELLGAVDKAAAEGFPPPGSSRRGRSASCWACSAVQNPFRRRAELQGPSPHLPVAERVRGHARPRDPRPHPVGGPHQRQHFPLITRLSFERMFPFGDPPDYAPRRETTSPPRPPARAAGRGRRRL